MLREWLNLWWFGIFAAALCLAGMSLGAEPLGGGFQDASRGLDLRERRTALVIGNGAYKDAPLRNPVNDARAMAAALRASGFEVALLEDASRVQMREAIRAFGIRLAEGGVGLFYFAGHGMQVRGRNFLIPVGVDIASEDEAASEAVEVDAILAKLETARNRLNILILDACRNNPFGRSFRGSQQGLAPMDAPTGTFVAFATAPGRTAADGTGAHGVYTGALLRQLQAPGLKLEDLFKRARAEVLQASAQQQTPWESSSVVGDFFFLPGTPASPDTAAAPVATPPPATPAASSWRTDSALQMVVLGLLDPKGLKGMTQPERLQVWEEVRQRLADAKGQAPDEDLTRLAGFVEAQAARLRLPGGGQARARNWEDAWAELQVLTILNANLELDAGMVASMDAKDRTELWNGFQKRLKQVTANRPIRNLELDATLRRILDRQHYWMTRRAKEV
jgi:uncharacterized caspase-like protein